VLTRLVIRRFKRLLDADIELGNPVVFVGPNDAGKTSALQALLLWRLGLSRYLEKRKPSDVPDTRPGIAINRKDLTGIPVPTARMLWHELFVLNNWREGTRRGAEHIRIAITVEGVDIGQPWTCGLEFDHANPESIYVRPLKQVDGSRMPIPEQAAKVNVALLAPMSGLAANETLLPPGAIDVRIGEGRTAEVLRNLCFQVAERDRVDGTARFEEVTERIHRLFGASLQPPEQVVERGEIAMRYRTQSGIELDLASAGRGLQQTLLLLTFLTLNRGAVVLLDEPDAHLEILRQRQTYAMLGDTARETGGQIIAASHSEVILNEAARNDVVIAFLGSPHRIDNRGKAQLSKALTDIGFDAYYAAEQNGWVLFLEGATDLAILRALAARLDHTAREALDRPFVDYVQNRPQTARSHFYGLREAVPGLRGFAVFDRLERTPDEGPEPQFHCWRRREIENYICQPETLVAWARATGGARSMGGLFEMAEADRWEATMRANIERLVPPIALEDPTDLFWIETKASDAFLDRLFERFFADLGIENLLRKTNYHVLADHIAVEAIDQELIQVLDRIAEVYEASTPSPLPGETPESDDPTE
jgi:ABC-type multidrug transport system ATPase subunit